MKRTWYLFLLVWAISLCVKAQQPVYLDSSQPLELRVEDALKRMTLAEKIAIIHAQSKFSSPGVKRLGIPDLWTSDGPHGVRPDVLWDEWKQAGNTNDSCVAFPALTCLAATWNPALALRYGKSLGEEALYRGKNVMLGPGVNIYRTPLNGRNFEYMGEDPLLTSRMVVPYIQGLQSNGVAACVKHYALNNDEEYRHQVNVVVSDRALHEIYLPAFKAAVTQGKAWAIMGAYNLYNNQHNCENEVLLNKILKKDWKFDGTVISDWGGAHSTEGAARNGLDLEFGTWTDGLTMGQTNAYDAYYLAKPYLEGLQKGIYNMDELNDKVRRVLRLHFRTTMNQHRGYGALCSEAHYATAQAIGAEGVVLLKNKGNLLPLNIQNAKRILVVGENAIKMMTVGGGSSSLKVQHEILPLDGLKTRLAQQVQIDYERGYVGDMSSNFDGVTTGQNLKEDRTTEQLIADAVRKAKGADYVIVFGGLNKSSYQDSEGNDRKSYDLPYAQNQLVEALLKANPRLIFVNISGNAVAMPWANRVLAILQGWFIGSEAGTVLAKVLCGDVNPSGKLPFTWPVALNDVAAHHLNTYPGTWRDDKKIIDETYKEGIYVGYRWVDKSGIRPLFAFGHGLSYTTFKLSNLRLNRNTMSSNDSIRVTVNVKNTGKRAGAQTVQLYVHDDECSTDRPQKELKAFGKVFLNPGENCDLTLTLDHSALSFYDEATQQWKAEPGTFTLLVGTASDQLPLKEHFTFK